jgi:lanosterol synthase
MTEANGTHRRGEKQKPISNGAVTSSTGRATKTDYTRWRLKDERGCQTWHYLETEHEIEQWPQTLADKWHLGLDLVRKHLFLQHSTRKKVDTDMS